MSMLKGTDHPTRERMRKELADLFQAERHLWPKNIKNIEDLKTTLYPPNFLLPDPELSFPVEPGRFRYHRDFLLQFMVVCTKKPVSLITLDSIGIEPRGSAGAGQRGDRGGRRSGNHHAGAMSAAAQLSSLPGVGQSRFEASTQVRSGAMPSAGGVASRLAPMSRSAGQGGVDDGATREAKRTRSQRGRDWGENTRASGFRIPAIQTGPLDYAPLERSDNAWAAHSTQHSHKQVEGPQLVDRKVKALLNKLTAANFDLISDQVIEWANRSEQEDDGSTLMRVIKLVFEHAKEGAVLSEAYARLCRKMSEGVSPNIQDQTIRNSGGQLITGGTLFRKYLLNRCQDDFEQGWKAKEVALACARLKIEEDETTQPILSGHGKQAARSEEHYIRAKATRQAVGLACLMGELLKSQVSTERITHECIKKLLSNVTNPEEVEILGLHALLTSAGRSLDNPKGRNHMDIYFERMQDMIQNDNLSLRMQFLLQDIVELRARKWQPRPPVPRPVPIPLRPGPPRKDSEQLGITGGALHRNEYRVNNPSESNSWRANGGAGTSRPTVRAGDLSQFGKISRPTRAPFGTSSAFSKSDSVTRESGTDGSGTNLFSAVSAGAINKYGSPAVFTTKGRGIGVVSEPSGSPATAGTSGRKKLNLLPRTKRDDVH